MPPLRPRARPTSAPRTRSPHSKATGAVPYELSVASRGPPLPPEQRLTAALEECGRLDRELRVIEASGHARIGAFARPLASQQRCKKLAQSAKEDPLEHLPEDPLSADLYVDDDDVTADPYFHRFFDCEGRTLYEQLLRGRMRVLALAKMVYTRDSAQYIEAETEIVDVYTRMNLWKQAHMHAMITHNLLRARDETAAAQRLAMLRVCGPLLSDNQRSDASGLDVLVLFLEYCYAQQLDPERNGQLVLSDLSLAVASWTTGDTSTTAVSAAVLEPSNLKELFGAAPYLHWQQLLLRLERQSALFQDDLRDAASLLPPAIHATFEDAFGSLDPSGFGVVPLRSLIVSLDAAVLSHDDAIAMCAVCEVLRRHDRRVQQPSITWSETLLLSRAALLAASKEDTEDPTRELRPRLKLFFGRFALRKGRVDDAQRYLRVAIVEAEQLLGTDDSALVNYYLAMAEALAVRSTQLAATAKQQAVELAESWLSSTEGTRRLRAKALEIIDDTARRSGSTIATMSKRDAEAQARTVLLEEYAALSLVRPDPAIMDEAIEFCTKAWTVQEKTSGRDHVTAATIHVALAQVHAMREDVVESVRSYELAIDIYERCCNGPVPASALLRLEIATLYQQHEKENAEYRGLALAALENVATFFHSFALDFASTDVTRRESCAKAVDAWRRWLEIAAKRCTLEQHQQILSNLHIATVDGYGEFSLQAAATGKELAELLVRTGQLGLAEQHLRMVKYILDAHFGPSDRRSRQVKRELVELSSQIKSATLHAEEEDHSWLQL
ncbi:hypothetical protein PINS_up000369 [Pythium insidiosum]|nr:hypothetical protein PINS_up000369 [Pythium insidiosum]